MNVGTKEIRHVGLKKKEIAVHANNGINVTTVRDIVIA